MNFDTNNFSVALWIKTSTDVEGTLFASRDYTDCNAHGTALNAYAGASGGVAGVTWRGSDDNKDSVKGSTVVTDDNWHHFIAIRDGEEIAIYVDGSLENSNSIDSSASLSTDLDFWIGRHQYCGGGGEFDGLIDEVRIYNRALSEDEIQELYTGSDSDCGDYDDGYEAGMQYCIDNPEACGIDTGDSGECEDCDLNGDGKVNGQDLSTWVDGCLGAKPE